jgi:uncharacterized alpha-E superfamily protein
MLRSRFQRARFRPQASQDDLTSFTRRYCDYAVRAVPEFFGTCQGTMIADGGWAFCEIGQLLERAIITGNAVCSIMRPMPRRSAPYEHEVEIRLSAFLRLINSRDAYRRVYQLRIEAAPMLDLLWKNPAAPRSVTRCLEACRERLRGAREQASPATMRTLAAIEQLLHEIRMTNWEKLATDAVSDSTAKPAPCDTRLSCSMPRSTFIIGCRRFSIIKSNGFDTQQTLLASSSPIGTVD